MRKGVVLGWLALLAVLCFGAGMSSGILFVYRRQAQTQPDFAYADELKKALDLTDDQYHQIRTVVESRGMALEGVYHRHEDSLKTELQPLIKAIDDEIKNVLNEEQKKKFEGRPMAPVSPDKK